jgi:YndJ-like protein
LIYLAIGGAWAVSDRLGFRPLDFDPVIVLLTAIHFHYAGFALPLVTGLAARRLDGGTARLAAAGVIAGVPLVAIGITSTQLKAGPLIESLAAWVLAAAGILTASLHLRLAFAPGRPLVRCLWAVAAVSLAGSMVLAAMYGSRFYIALSWLDIPWMRAFHGTANALGFGLAGLLAWVMARGFDFERM